jgi:hypothetical protein
VFVIVGVFVAVSTSTSGAGDLSEILDQLVVFSAHSSCGTM